MTHSSIDESPDMFFNFVHWFFFDTLCVFITIYHHIVKFLKINIIKLCFEASKNENFISYIKNLIFLKIENSIFFNMKILLKHR